MYPNNESEITDVCGKLQLTAYEYDPGWAWHEGPPGFKVYVSEQIQLKVWTPSSGHNEGKYVPIYDSQSKVIIDAMIAKAKQEGFGCVHLHQPAVVVEAAPLDNTKSQKFSCRNS